MHYIIFKLGQEVFALPNPIEIFPVPNVHKPPMISDCVAGFFMSKGELVTMLNLGYIMESLPGYYIKNIDSIDKLAFSVLYEAKNEFLDANNHKTFRKNIICFCTNKVIKTVENLELQYDKHPNPFIKGIYRCKAQSELGDIGLIDLNKILLMVKSEQQKINSCDLTQS